MLAADLRALVEDNLPAAARAGLPRRLEAHRDAVGRVTRRPAALGRSAARQHDDKVRCPGERGVRAAKEAGLGGHDRVRAVLRPPAVAPDRVSRKEGVPGSYDLSVHDPLASEAVSSQLDERVNGVMPGGRVSACG